MFIAGRLLFYGVIASIAIWVAWMATDNRPPYDYLGREMGSRIEPSPAKQGSQVRLHWKLNVYRTCKGAVQRYLVDRDTLKIVAAYDMTGASVTVKMGDRDLYKTFQLPPGLPPRVEYRATVYFQCNLLQRIWPLVVEAPHIPFDIVD